MSRIRGKTVLVTGASGGLGREFGRQLLARGADLVLSDRDDAGLADVARALRVDAPRLPGSVRATLAADLSTRDGCDDLVRRCETLGIAPDLLIHNAGMLAYGLFHEGPLDRIYALYQVNTGAPMHLTSRFLPRMIARGTGHVLFMCSVSGFVPTAFETAYSASKFAMRGFGMALRRELTGTGVHVTLVYPFWVDTPMLHSPSFGSMVARRVPTLFVQSPQTVVRAALNGVERSRTHVYPGVWPQLTWWLSKLGPLTGWQPVRPAPLSGAPANRGHDGEIL